MSECAIVGCDASATQTVEGPNGIRRVCVKCRDELVAIFGFKSGAATETVTMGVPQVVESDVVETKPAVKSDTFPIQATWDEYAEAVVRIGRLAGKSVEDTDE